MTKSLTPSITSPVLCSHHLCLSTYRKVEVTTQLESVSLSQRPQQLPHQLSLDGKVLYKCLYRSGGCHGAQALALPHHHNVIWLRLISEVAVCFGIGTHGTFTQYRTRVHCIGGERRHLLAVKPKQRRVSWVASHSTIINHLAIIF